MSNTLENTITSFSSPNVCNRATVNTFSRKYPANWRKLQAFAIRNNTQNSAWASTPHSWPTSNVNAGNCDQKSTLRHATRHRLVPGIIINNGSYRSTERRHTATTRTSSKLQCTNTSHSFTYMQHQPNLIWNFYSGVSSNTQPWGPLKHQSKKTT